MSRLFACLFACSLAPGVQAETPALHIELNSLNAAQTGCTLTFVVQNAQENDIEHAIWEAVIFDVADRVDRLTLFDFGALPAGRPRVRQFLVPDLACDQVGRVLFNGLHQCEAPEGTSCDGNLKLDSRVSAELVG